MRDRARPPRPRSISPRARDRRPRRRPRRRCELRRQRSCSRCARQFIEDADDEDQPTWNIWEYDIATRDAAPHHRVGHASRTKATTSCRTTCPTAASCSPRRASDRRARFCSTRASRSSPRRTKDGDEPAFVLHVMDADGSEHPPDVVQPEPRSRSGGARERPDRLHPLGARAATTANRSVQRESGRQRARAAVRREQPRDRHPTRRPTCRPSFNSSARARCRTAARWRWSDRSTAPTTAAIWC